MAINGCQRLSTAVNGCQRLSVGGSCSQNTSRLSRAVAVYLQHEKLLHWHSLITLYQAYTKLLNQDKHHAPEFFCLAQLGYHY